MPMFDYKCKCGHLWNDHIVARGKDEVKCPQCNEVMERVPNVQVNTKWDRLVPSYMPPPQHIVDNPRAYYE